ADAPLPTLPSRRLAQIRRDHLDDMLAAAAERLGRAEGAPKDGGQREAVGEIEEAERGDIDVELDRIDAFAELACPDAPLQRVGEQRDQRRMQRDDPPRFPKVPPLEEVLG